MKTKIKLNEIDHKTYIGNYVYKHKSINTKELKRIKPEIIIAMCLFHNYLKLPNCLTFVNLTCGKV
jgi:hypothetical protein